MPTPHYISRLLPRSSTRLYASRSKGKPSATNAIVPPSKPKRPLLFVGYTTAQALLFSGFLGWGMVFGISIHSYIHEEEEPISIWNRSGKRPKPDLPRAISLLHSLFPQQGRVITEDKILQAYSSTDFTAYIGSDDAKPHGVIVFPLSTEDVVTIVKIAAQCGLSVVSRGAGTGLEGHVTSTTGNSICIDLSRMQHILAVHEQDFDIICQAGMTWDGINRHLGEHGIPLFIPLDPAPGATVGGMLATGCSGTNAVRYGTARAEWFLNATVVLPSGEVIKTRKRAHKSSAGFDLTQLFIGAEGTLGIVTEVTLKLAPILPSTVAVAQFPKASNAAAAVDELLKSQYGMHIQCVELADSRFMEALNHYINPSAPASSSNYRAHYPITDTLFIKIQGNPASIKETSTVAQAILAKHRCTGLRFANGKEEADEMWGHRREALLAILSYIEGSSAWTTDVCVPVSNLPRLVQQVKDDAAAAGIIAPIVGHVGDGNFHAALIYRNDNEFKKVQKFSEKIVERALELDGTCTGEHGVGVGKRRYLEHELGKGTVDLMRTIKKALDPNNMMNPGKLYPPAS